MANETSDTDDESDLVENESEVEDSDNATLLLISKQFLWKNQYFSNLICIYREYSL